MTHHYTREIKHKNQTIRMTEPIGEGKKIAAIDCIII